jgi:ankyrin repeat protein
MQEQIKAEEEEAVDLDLCEALFRYIHTQDRKKLQFLIDTHGAAAICSDEVRDSLGNTPLMAACCIGARRIMRFLLKNAGLASTIDRCNTLGNTALHFATEFGYDGCCRTLVKKGASEILLNELGCISGDRVHVAE